MRAFVRMCAAHQRSDIALRCRKCITFFSLCHSRTNANDLLKGSFVALRVILLKSDKPSGCKQRVEGGHVLFLTTAGARSWHESRARAADLPTRHARPLLLPS